MLLDEALYLEARRFVCPGAHWLLLSLVEDLVYERHSLALKELSLGVLGPINEFLIESRWRQFLPLSGLDRDHGLLFAVRPESADPLMHPVVVRHIVAIDSPLLISSRRPLTHLAVPALLHLNGASVEGHTPFQRLSRSIVAG